jgi:hypothetical protein
LIAVSLWTVLAIDFAVAGPMDRLGKVKGTDFLHFYVIGSLVHEHRWNELYDVRAQLARTEAIAPQSKEILFLPVESPQMALMFAPLAMFEYTTALALWLGVGLLLYAASCVLLWRDCTILHRYRDIVMAACIGFPGLFSAVLHGQTAWLALLCIVGALVALRRGRRFVAGLALGMMVFKPHWALVAGVVFLCAGEWRVVAGSVVAVVAQLVLVYATAGSAVMDAYWRMLRTLPRIVTLLEPTPVDSLKGYFQVLVPWPSVALALYGAAAVCVIATAARTWRSGAALDLRLACLVMAIILTNPHVNAYDLLLLTPVLFLVASWYLEHARQDTRMRAVPVLLVLLFMTPILAGVPPIIRLQFSVGVMAALLGVVAYGKLANPISWGGVLRRLQASP